MKKKKIPFLTLDLVLMPSTGLMMRSPLTNIFWNRLSSVEIACSNNLAKDKILLV